VDDRGRSRPRPQAGELVSLVERAGTLGALRGGFAIVVVAFALLVPGALVAPRSELAAASLLYLGLLITPWAVRRRSTGAAVRIIGLTLLVDGLYLAWATYATGGTQSPLRFLLFAHLVAVTLLASSRTGLKIAAWHSLLVVVTAYAQAAALVPEREALASALPGGDRFVTQIAVSVGALWVVAVRERELRTQKVDLEALSDTVAAMDACDDVAELPGIMLDGLAGAFGIRRGLVLASPEGDLEVVAHRGIAIREDHDDDAHPGDGLDRVVERAWQERRTQLVRGLDPAANPRLGALLPGAGNVLVVPLLVHHGFRLGVVVLEHPQRRASIRRWMVAIVDQFAAHGALAIHNAWLRGQLEGRLAENRALQQQLIAQNLDLELKVEERTRDLSESLATLREIDEQRSLLLARLVHAEEELRRSISEDIHDDPVQKLVGGSMWLQLLRKELTTDKQLQTVDKVLFSLHAAVDSMRTLIFQLRPEALDTHGLGPALEEYLESLEAEFEHHVENRLELEPPGDVAVILFRMAQEALANVRKHAKAHTVGVLLAEEDGGYLVRITDDGVGFSTAQTTESRRGHLGLSSMRERAGMAGGWCRLHSLPGQGTTVELWVPRPATAEPDGDPGRVVRVPRPAAEPGVGGGDEPAARPAVPA
jgi:signal transduction histidine kinase